MDYQSLNSGTKEALDSIAVESVLDSSTDVLDSSTETSLMVSTTRTRTAAPTIRFRGCCTYMLLTHTLPLPTVQRSIRSIRFRGCQLHSLHSRMIDCLSFPTLHTHAPKRHKQRSYLLSDQCRVLQFSRLSSLSPWWLTLLRSFLIIVVRGCVGGQTLE